MTFDEIAPKFGEISTALETNASKLHQDTALGAMREEYGTYFEALETHPRLLVGREVPSMRGDGMEVLRDSQDAADWQEAVKSVLVGELRDRVGRAMEEDSSMLTLLHGSVELFQNNADLVPGTKGFDKELAAEFARIAKPYEHRSNGKLVGYNIPVQPLVEQVRTGLVARRAAASAAAAQPPVPPQQPSRAQATQPPAPAPAAPQAGIPSKAGASSDEVSDFSVLFGTLGLPNLRI